MGSALRPGGGRGRSGRALVIVGTIDRNAHGAQPIQTQWGLTTVAADAATETEVVGLKHGQRRYILETQ